MSEMFFQVKIVKINPYNNEKCILRKKCNKCYKINKISQEFCGNAKCESDLTDERNYVPYFKFKIASESKMIMSIEGPVVELLLGLSAEDYLFLCKKIGFDNINNITEEYLTFPNFDIYYTEHKCIKQIVNIRWNFLVNLKYNTFIEYILKDVSSEYYPEVYKRIYIEENNELKNHDIKKMYTPKLNEFKC